MSISSLIVTPMNLDLETVAGILLFSKSGGFPVFFTMNKNKIIRKKSPGDKTLCLLDFSSSLPFCTKSYSKQITLRLKQKTVSLPKNVPKQRQRYVLLFTPNNTQHIFVTKISLFYFPTWQLIGFLVRLFNLCKHQFLWMLLNFPFISTCNFEDIENCLYFSNSIVPTVR